MMFKFLNKTIGLQWILFVLILSIATFQIFKESVFMDAKGFPVLYTTLYNYLLNKTLLRHILIFIFLLSSIIGLQFYFNKSNFAPKTSLFPSLLYLSILVFSGNLKVVSPIFFTNFFIIIILLLNDHYQRTRSKSSIYYSGLLIGLSLLIDPSSIVLLFFLIASMIINTVVSSKDIMVTLIGIITVGIYVIVYYFFIDGFEALQNNLSQIQIFNIFKVHIQLRPVQWIFIISNIIITLYLVVKTSLIYENKIILMRKRVISINALLFCLMGTLLITGIMPEFFIRYYYIPISLLVSILIQTPHKFFLNEVLVLLLMIGICV